MEKVREFFAKDWTMEEKVLFTAAVLLAGIVAGLILAPFKSISFGNYNGNNYGQAGQEEEGEESI